MSEIASENEVILMDFWAEWCPPCKAMSPVLDEIASELPNVKVVKINIDENPEKAEEYNIKSIPTFVLFGPRASNVPTKILVGAMPKKKLVEAIQSVL